MPWPDHVPQDESGDSLRMRYSRRRAPGPGIPTTLLLPRRMLLLGTDASRRATGSRQYVAAYRSRSSAYTRYRNRSYAPSRPTERDSPCRIRHRLPCHTSRPPPEYVEEPMGVAGAPTSDIRCAAMLELAGNQDRGTVHQPPPAGDSPFGDPNTTCTERASGVDAGNSHLTPTGRPRPYMRRRLFADRGKLRATGASTSGRRRGPGRFCALARPAICHGAAGLLAESLLAAAQARVSLLDEALSRRDMTR